jgi:hypothetical protein
MYPIQGFFIHTALNKANINLAIDEINKIVKKVKSKKIDKELLEISKNNFLFHSVVDSVSDACSIANLYFSFDEKTLVNVANYDLRMKKVINLTQNDILEGFNNIFQDDPMISIQTND